MAMIQLNSDSATLVLNGFAVTDLAEGDIIELNPVNPLSNHVNAGNGGGNINKRADSGVHDLVVRVQKFSASDVYLNSAVHQENITVFNGSVKEDFIRDGVEGTESYILENGSITTRPSNVKNNTEGNGVMEYTLRFRNVYRSI